MFDQVSHMNEAYGNPKGNPNQIDFDRVTKQCSNILDEYDELVMALENKDPIELTDALCDIMVFTLGAFHIAGIDANAAMTAVYESNMSKFVKDAEDEEKTAAKYTSLDVAFRFEGDYPTRRCRCTSTRIGLDGETYRENKILKSASYHKPKFA